EHRPRQQDSGRQMESLRTEVDDERRQQIEGRASDEAGTHADEHATPIGSKHVEQGNLDRSVLLNDLPEFRCLVDLEANVERNAHEEEGQEERNAPSPCDE